MIGVELRDKAAAAPSSDRASTTALIVLTCGPGENVLRLIPPLTLARRGAGSGLAILTLALAEV